MYIQLRDQYIKKTKKQNNGDLLSENGARQVRGPANGKGLSFMELESRCRELEKMSFNLMKDKTPDDEPNAIQTEQNKEEKFRECIQELLALNQQLVQGLSSSMEREQAYQTLINSTEELILLLDASGNILVANDAFIKSLNLDAKAAREQKITDLVPNIANACREQIEELKQSEQETCFQCWHGTELYEVKIYPVYDQNGALLHRALFSNNVTQKTRETEALNNSRRQLQELSLNIFDTLESERKKIAQDLHDHVGQSLGAVKYSIESLIEQYSELFSENQEQHLSGLVKWIQVTIKELMRIISDLRPPMLDELGFEYTIGWFCRQYDEFYQDLEVQSEISLLEKDIDEPVKTILFRVIQEAFNNTVNHSQGTLLRLYVGRENGWVFFSITDNGIGFDPQKVLSDSRKPGFGLMSMKERIARLGGQVEFISSANKGTVIQGYLPE